MPHPDARNWNQRYEEEADRYMNRPVYAIVETYARQLPPNSLVLDMAAGASPAGLYLAARGHRLVGLDISEAGLRLAQRKARAADLSVSLAVMDLHQPQLPGNKFDVILNFFFLSRPLLPIYRQALKPGGWLFFETFVRQPGQVLDSPHFLEKQELHDMYSDWEIIHTEEYIKTKRHDWAYDRMVSQLVARKI